MTIHELSDTEAFLKMLRLIFRIISNVNQEKLIEYIYRFCELDQQNIDFDHFFKNVKSLLKARATYKNDKKFVELKIDCYLSGLINATSKDSIHCMILESRMKKQLVFIEANSKQVVYMPVKVQDINKESIKIKVICLEKKKIKTEQIVGTNILIDDFKIAFNQIKLIEGYDITLVYDVSKKKFEPLIEQYKKKSLFPSHLNSHLKSLIKFQLSSKISANKLDENFMSNQPLINFKVSWFHFNPVEFPNFDMSLKNQLIKRHRSYVSKHLDLLKYLFKRRMKQINNAISASELLLADFKFERFFGENLQIIIRESLFEGALNYADHFVCIRQVIKDLVTKKNEISSKDWNYFDIASILEKNYESLCHLSEQTFTLSNSEDEYFTFLINPFEHLNNQIPYDLPFRPINFEKKHHSRKATLYNLMTTEKKFQVQLPFNFETMKHRFLNDFDLNSKYVAIWVSSSFHKVPCFFRFSTKKSLGLFDYNIGIRKQCIYIYASMSYRIILFLIIIFEFFSFSALPFEHQIFFLPLHVFDALISIIAKGLIFTEYSYLSNIWYYGDGLLTIIYFFTYFFYLTFSEIDSLCINYALGLAMLTVIARVFRLIREVKNSSMLVYFRILLNIIGKMVIQLFPLLILAFFVIIFTSVLAMNTMNDIFNYICFPDEFDYDKFNEIAKQSLRFNFLNNEFSFAEYGFFRTNINQTLYMYDYRPCVANDWYPLASKCRKGEKCRKISNELIRYLNRQSPNFVTFNNSYSTFFLILTMIFNQDSDIFFHRIVHHTGLYGYIFCLLLHLFGFYIISLILALISDLYEIEQMKQTIDFNDNVKFFQDEAEFSFMPDFDFMVCYKQDVTDQHKINGEDLKSSVNKRLKLNEGGKWIKKIKMQFKNLTSLYRTGLYKNIEMKNVKKITIKQNNLTFKQNDEKLQFDKILDCIRFDQNTNTNYSRYFFYDLFNFLKSIRKYLQGFRTYEYRQMNFLIEYIIWTKFFVNLCLFEIEEPLDYAHLFENNSKIYQYMLSIDNFLTLLMTIEMTIKILTCGCTIFFSKSLNYFDLFIVLINILSSLLRYSYPYQAILLSPFCYLRILSVLYVKWKLLKIISASIAKAKNQIRANIVLYCIIFILLTVFSYRFLNTFIFDHDDDDMLNPETSFESLFNSLITVFYLLFKFEWTPIAFNYLLFNKDTENGKPMFTFTTYRFIEYLPFIVETYLIISIFVHLFFKELFVPQLIYYLDITKFIQIHSLDYQKTKIYEKNPKLFFDKERLKKFFKNLKFENFLKRNKIFFIYRAFESFSSFAFYVEMFNLFYFLVRDNLKIETVYNNLAILIIGIFLQVFFLFNVILKQIESLNYSQFLTERNLFVWKFLALLFEVGTLGFTILSIINHYKVTKYLEINLFCECMVWIGLWRIVYYFPAVRESLKLLLFNISIITQFLILVIGLFLFLAFIGLSLFKNRLSYCLMVNGDWFYLKKRALGTIENIYNSKVHNQLCIDPPYINDVFYFHHLQVRVDEFPHFFNFDTILNAIESIFHIMNGADLSTIQLISSIKEFDQKEKNVNIIFWPFILIIVILGILVDAFIFSIITELLNKSLRIETIYNRIRNYQMRCVYLAICNITLLFPWEDYNYQKQYSNKYSRFIIKLISSKLYNKIQTIVILINILFTTIQWKFNLQFVDYFENLFLLNYLFDGILRISLVGKEIFLYPSLILYDLVFPFILYTLFVSGFRLSTRLSWSIFISFRFLYPDRYLRFNFIRKSNVIIRTIVNSFLSQLYLIAILIFLILSFSKIGIILFKQLNSNFLIFEPNQMPYFYSTLFYSFVHLTSTAFTDNYDSSIITMNIKNEFCLKADPYHRYYLIADKQIAKALDTSIEFRDLLSDNNANYNQSSKEDALVKCLVKYENADGYHLHFLYNGNSMKTLLNIIRKACEQDELISSSEFLDCKFHINHPLKQIRFLSAFRIAVNNDIKRIYKSNLPKGNLSLKEKNNFSFSKQFGDFLRSYCSQIIQKDRYSIIEIDDPRRKSNYSKIVDWIRLDFLNLFRSVLTNKLMNKLSMDQICSNRTTIALFYLFFFIIARFIFLNILKALLFSRYDIEKLRDNNFSNTEIQKFINSWRLFEESHGHHSSELNVKTIDDYLPVDLVVKFVRNMCPTNFRINVQDDESCIYILSKYSINSVILNGTFNLHLLDVMAVCIATQVHCSPTVFSFVYPQIIKELDVNVLRVFPTYVLNQNKLNSLEQAINQHYSTILLILSLLK